MKTKLLTAGKRKPYRPDRYSKVLAVAGYYYLGHRQFDKGWHYLCWLKTHSNKYRPSGSQRVISV